MRQLEPIEILQKNIQVLSTELWNDKIKQPDIKNWLNNFEDERERINALYLLSKLVYFGYREISESLKALYRDKIKYPMLKKIRQENNNNTDPIFLNKLFQKKLNHIRILGVGNPSESGVHLLYMFRQINRLPKDIFINSHDIFSWSKGKQVLRNKEIEEYIFIDDLCGSGTQAKRYSIDIVKKIKAIDSTKSIKYVVLVATTEGLKNIRESNMGYNDVDAIFTLDDSFKCFSEQTRYFHEGFPEIEKDFSREMCLQLRNKLQYRHVRERINPLGYKDAQLLLSFFHNTPNNTLPIFWFEDEGNKWIPIFKRYPKIYKI